MQILGVREDRVRIRAEEVRVPDVEQAHEERDVLLRGGIQEMLIYRVEAREELLEAVRADRDREGSTDR